MDVGTILRPLGPRNYEVLIENHRWKRHEEQIRRVHPEVQESKDSYSYAEPRADISTSAETVNLDSQGKVLPVPVDSGQKISSSSEVVSENGSVLGSYAYEPNIESWMSPESPALPISQGVGGSRQSSRSNKGRKPARFSPGV